MLACRASLVVLAAVALATSSGAEPAAAVGGPAAPRPGQVEVCEPSGDPIELTSAEQVESLIVGTWIHCGGARFNGAGADDVGVEVTADGRFYQVFRLPDGTLARATGPLRQGEWVLRDNTELGGPGAYRIDWRRLSDGEFYTVPRFFDLPSMLELEDVTAMPTLSTYERWTGPDPVTDQPPVTVGECPALGEPIELTSVAETTSFLTGTWVRCDGDALPGAAVDDVGLEVTADGRFYRVYELDDGSFARATGPQQEGDWFVTDTTDVNGPGFYQVDWALLGGGMWIDFPQFFDASPDADQPAMLHLPSQGHFARWTGAPPVTDQPPVTVGDCPALGEPHEVTSVDGFQAALVGTWIRCAGDAFRGAQVDDVGIEVTADGHFYRVFRLPDGTLARATGPGQEGDWIVWDTTEMNGPGWYQVDWRLMATGGGSGNFPQFFGPSTNDGEPSLLHLRQSTEDAYYERWTGPAPVTDQPPVTVGDCPPLGKQVIAEPFETALVGTWIRCEGPGFAVGSVGIEVRADGRFHLLQRLVDGTLTRSADPAWHGEWVAVDTTEVNGPGWYQVSWTLDGRPTQTNFPQFFDTSPDTVEPSMVRIPVGYYQRWTGAPPTVAPSTTTTTATTTAQSGPLPVTGPDRTATVAGGAISAIVLGLALGAVAGTRRRDRSVGNC